MKEHFADAMPGLLRMLHRLRRIQQRLEERKNSSVTEFYGSDDDEDEVCKSEGNNWRKMETAWTGGGKEL